MVSIYCKEKLKDELGRRERQEAKWKKEASDEEEITAEDLEKWKEDEERHEREEAEAKRRKIEEEERRCLTPYLYKYIIMT